ncbi:phospholipid scramblase family protein [Actinoallomurus rhizosphaericola]|uniref:phospholipid scramblase family protein n=1 Tax=Actinoallomurus rhizosphaericola TaxID=2952536 RepID=UPI002092AC8E|nr:phospholipid scramblase family protein [Actinoallomurus rhizosphaericola]MCO5999687.1 phospholipid scramblase family protein [Actinoallomurus rhizosphaericola]
MDVLFDSPVVRLRQPGKILPTQASYEILDDKRNRLAFATETDRRTRLQMLKATLPTAPPPGARILTVTGTDDQAILLLTRHPNGRLAEVHRPDGGPVGRIRATGTTRHYKLTDDQEQVVATAVGELSLKHFQVTAASGARIAHVSKTWAGPVKEWLTPSDHYKIEFNRDISEPARTLTVMLAIMLDLSLFGPM